MKKPRKGWPKYKGLKNRNKKSDDLQLHKLGNVFLAWGVISLFMSLFFDSNINQKTYSFDPSISYQADKSSFVEDMQNNTNSFIPEYKNPLTDKKGETQLIGPIETKNKGETFEIIIVASLPNQSWSVIEGEVLNEEKEYLFSFAKELWYETGSDSDGYWSENKNNYKMKITFPKTGKYYLNFKTESNNMPQQATATISKKRGSSLPHLWFGIICILIGLHMYNFYRKLWEAIGD